MDISDVAMKSRPPPLPRPPQTHRNKQTITKGPMCTCTGRRRKSKANWRTAWHKAEDSQYEIDEHAWMNLWLIEIQPDVKNVCVCVYM